MRLYSLLLVGSEPTQTRCGAKPGEKTLYGSVGKVQCTCRSVKREGGMKERERREEGRGEREREREREREKEREGGRGIHKHSDHYVYACCTCTFKFNYQL